MITNEQTIDLSSLLATVEQSLAACAKDSASVALASRRLADSADRLRELGEEDWSLCCRTLADLLEIASCFADNSDTPGSECTTEIVEYVRSAFPRVQAAVTSAATDDAIPPVDLIDQAHARWGEFLTYVGSDGFHAACSLDVDVSAQLDVIDHDPATDHSDEQVALILSAVQELADKSESIEHERYEPASGAAESDEPGAACVTANPNDTSGPAAPPAPQLVELGEILRLAYLEDAEQCLASMERAVMTFENDPQSKVPIDQLCRDLHTLKGASATVGLSDLASYLHQVEEWLPVSARHSEGRKLQPIFDCIDFVRSQMDVLQPGNRSTVAAPLPAPMPAPQPVIDAPSRGDRAVAPGEETIRIRSSQLDRMMDLLVELVIWRRRRDRRVTELEESSDELDRCTRRLETLANQEWFHRVAVASSPVIATSAQEATGGAAKILSEITSDLREISNNVRTCRQSMSDENRAVSQFIQQFRQQLAQAQRVPLSGLFQRLQRVAREAARLEGKQVRLECIGQNSGLERSLQERLFEPLMHLVRNAVCHGIETEEKRLQKGKSAVGTITLEAIGNSQMLLLEVRDDGGGLDFDAIRQRGIERGLLRADHPVSPRELSHLIFHPGFSTRAEANEVAGRGVGMDIVLTALSRVHCQIDVQSESGIGTTFRLAIPLPSIIEHSLVFRCGGQLFGLPMQFVMSTSLGDSSSVPGDSARCLPAMDLREILGLQPLESMQELPALVLGSNLQPKSHSTSDPNGGPSRERSPDRQKISVDEILGPEEVVVRPVPALLRGHPVVNGVTLSGTGETVLLLNGPRLLKVLAEVNHVESSSQKALRAPAADAVRPSGGGRTRILIAEDSLSARRRLLEKLSPYGFELTEAGDGEEALNYARTTVFDAIFSDLEMPGLNGFELLEAIRSDPRATDKPVVIVTSRNEPETRAKALELGANAFLSKPVSDAMIEALLQQLAIIPQT